MTKVHHINCVKIITPTGDQVIGHCLLLEDKNGLALVDTGIGLLDTQHPKERIGKQLIDIVGFVFEENTTAVKRIEQLGLNPTNVNDCIITHLDPDHIGGSADFPKATLHVSLEEYQAYQNSKNYRYLPQQLSHNPIIKTYPTSPETWFGLEARKVNINFDTEIYLIPLFGHTLGHCGVAIRQEKNWLFHIGDAYYLRIELTDNSHPVNDLVKARAEDNELRLRSLDKIRHLTANNFDIKIFGCHDIEEFKYYSNQVD